MRQVQAAFVALLLALVAFAPSAFAQDNSAQDGPLQPKVQHNAQPARPDEPLVTAKHGMVVSAQHLATRSRSAMRWRWCIRAVATSAAAVS